ncbi:hypothetical protein [Streptococcus sp. 121]|nr:hypothetical protein [Streptococcus sp. 121]
MLQLIWSIVSALVALAVGLFVVSIMIMYIVFFIKELKKAAKE